MNRKIVVRCRLAALLKEKGVTPEDLAEISGLDMDRIQTYLTRTPEPVSLREVGAMLTALGCTSVDALLEARLEPDSPPEALRQDAPPMFEDEWFSPCPASPDGWHLWFKDTSVSDTVYQEYVCQACHRRISVIL